MASPKIDVGLKGGLVTFGLGRPACQGMITMMPFQLACFLPAPPPPPPPVPGVSGGTIPLEPGEIHDFYQPVDLDSEGTFVDPSVYGKKHVVIRVKSEFFEGEKEFLVSTERVKGVVKAVNIINTTITKIRAAVQNLKQYAIKATITVKNLKRKRDE